MSELNGLQIYEGKYTGPQRDAHFDWQTNHNLLDNPYFIGGGTSGKFPINQRGLTTYTTEGYAIDRWRVSTNGSARTLTLTSSGVTISKTGGTYVGLFQPLPADFVAQLCGKTVTLSALYGTELIKVTVTIPSTITQVEIAIQFGTAGWVQIWGVAGGLLDIGLCTTSDSTTILAVKLELGTQQTLAHQENGVWVLNEIPDYGEELRKCQRYFLRLTSGWAGNGAARSTTSAFIFAPVSTMAGNVRTPISYSNIKLYDYSAGSAISVSNITRAAQSETGISLDVTAENLTAKAPYLLYIDTNGYIDFDADL